MPYNNTIEEDLARARVLLVEGKGHEPGCPAVAQQCTCTAEAGDTILYKDLAVAYQLLASFVDEIERLRGAAEAAHDFAAKLHFLVDWADQRGLLPAHVFTFPDGDAWEAGHSG